MMKATLLRSLPAMIGSCLLVLALVGCGQSGPPAPLPVDQVPSALSTAFANAQPDLKEWVGQAVSALQSRESGKALMVLEGVCAAPELTPAQWGAATRALLALNQQLQAAAAKGDPQAIEAVRLRQVHK